MSRVARLPDNMIFGAKFKQVGNFSTVNWKIFFEFSRHNIAIRIRADRSHTFLRPLDYGESHENIFEHALIRMAVQFWRQNSNAIFLLVSLL